MDLPPTLGVQTNALFRNAISSRTFRPDFSSPPKLSQKNENIVLTPNYQNAKLGELALQNKSAIQDNR